ncbi:MAG: hypothetical protein CL670_14575 [Balneola sp.]|jgi:hypothetical protein|nr:hypothetical protein [Balneola sp.]MBE80381.1 hypothetical protein [Balneola sp.]|tara:strand:+ start:3295 stop:3549 length:255 start_codon:yes stop_codon:yes gene_type:complete
MKNTITWLCGILIGGLSGYGIGVLQTSNPYLWLAVGIILGSSIAVTYNIHREDDDLFDDLESEDATEPEENTINRDSANRQTTS